MALLNDAPPPIFDPISRPRRPEYKGDRQDPQEGTITDAWVDWFTNLIAQQGRSPGRVATVELSAQTASISTTDMTDGALTAGLYWLTYSLRITQTDAGGATVAVAINWTGDSGLARQFAIASLSAASSLTPQHAQMLIRIDNATPVTYATTVVVGGGNMIYALDIVLSEVKA